MHTENSMQSQQLECFSFLKPILVSLCKIRHSTAMPQKTAQVFLIMALGIQFSAGFFLERTESIQAFTTDANPHPPTDLRGKIAPRSSWRPWWAQADQWGEWNLFGWLGPCEVEGRVDVVRLVLKDSWSGNVEHFPEQASLCNASPHLVCTVIRGWMRKGVSPYRFPLWFCICCPQDTLILLPFVPVVHLSPDDSNPYEAGSAGSSKAHSGLTASMLLQNTSCKRPLISQIPSFPLPKHGKEIQWCIIGSSFDLRHHEKNSLKRFRTIFVPFLGPGNILATKRIFQTGTSMTFLLSINVFHSKS